MGFREPHYNAWARCWKPISDGVLITDVTWQFLGYFRCQVRDFGDHNVSIATIEVPRHLAFKHRSMTPFRLGFRIQVAGWETMWAIVFYVGDVGAGFLNEHRSLMVEFPRDETWDSYDGLYMPAVDPLLEPPPDALMMGTQPPADYWEEPNMGALWNTP